MTKKAVVCAALVLISGAWTGAGAAEEPQRMSIPKPEGKGITCANVRCAPGFTCVEKGPKRCIPIPQPAPEEGGQGDRKVKDLDLFACVNGLDVQAQNRDILNKAGNTGKGLGSTNVSSPKAQPAYVTTLEVRALGCLKKFGYFDQTGSRGGSGEGKVCAQGGVVPQCYPVRWDSKTCRWVCGKVSL